MSTENGPPDKTWPEVEKTYNVDYDVLRLPPSTSGDFVRQMFEKKELSEGTLLFLNFKGEFGSIEQPGGNDGVTFLFRNVVNLCDQEVVFAKGMKLKFSPDRKMPTRYFSL